MNFDPLISTFSTSSKTKDIYLMSKSWDSSFRFYFSPSLIKELMKACGVWCNKVWVAIFDLCFTKYFYNYTLAVTIWQTLILLLPNTRILQLFTARQNCHFKHSLLLVLENTCFCFVNIFYDSSYFNHLRGWVGTVMIAQI